MVVVNSERAAPGRRARRRGAVEYGRQWAEFGKCRRDAGRLSATLSDVRPFSNWRRTTKSRFPMWLRVQIVFFRSPHTARTCVHAHTDLRGLQRWG